MVIELVRSAHHHENGIDGRTVGRTRMLHKHLIQRASPVLVHLLVLKDLHIVFAGIVYSQSILTAGKRRH